MIQSELPNQSLQVYDVDGTLDTAGGCIKLAWLKPIKDWGILSSKSVTASKRVLKKLKPMFIEVCRVNMRAEELLFLKEKYPGYKRYIYIADREIDRSETIRAGWEFCFAHQWRH